jgi:hypothetical protein
LNEITPTKFEAITDIGKYEMRLLIAIYNWRVGHPLKKIYLALADITACFHCPRIHADVTGALYFLATHMVFGSNTSASSWEPF